ncbi:uncharacterized protein [Dermacentor andersoni]|nr:elastin-like isoform X3 [Dermacentor andersoni]
MKNSRPGRDEEGGAGGGGGGGGGGIFPGLDQWTNLLPGGTLPAGVTMPDIGAAASAVSGIVTMPDIGAAASAVSGIVTMPPNLPTAIPPAIPTNLPPGFPTGIPNINDIISSLPGVNP